LSASPARTGFLLMAASSLLFSLMSAAVRMASEVPAHTLSFIRFAFGAAVVLTLVAAGRAHLRTGNPRFLFWRGLLGGLAVYLFYLAICKVGLAKGTVLSYTYPIFVPVFGALVLRERVRLNVGIGILVAFVGVYLIVSPGNMLQVTRYDAAGLLSGVFSASAIVCIKRLRETDSPFVIFLSQCVFGMLLVGVPAVQSGFDFPARLLPALAGVALFAVTAQLLMTYSYKLVPATSGSLMGYLTPVFNVALGVAAFNEKLGHTGVVGCVLVLAVSLYITLVGAQPPEPRS
jgi:drug/metabolite transporter (DMT)-like permease